jgi:hypothetical protein
MPTVTEKALYPVASTVKSTSAVGWPASGDRRACLAQQSTARIENEVEVASKETAGRAWSVEVVQRCVKQRGENVSEGETGVRTMGSPPEHLRVFYTLGDSPSRLWNAELARQSACHASGMVQHGWYAFCVTFTETTCLMSFDIDNWNLLRSVCGGAQVNRVLSRFRLESPVVRDLPQYSPRHRGRTDVGNLPGRPSLGQVTTVQRQCSSPQLRQSFIRLTTRSEVPSC